MSDKNLYVVQGNISLEDSIQACIAKAKSHFGPINILIANAGITDESHEYPIWQIPLDLWQKVYDTNIKGTFLTIKHFLQSAERSQQELEHELDNLAIVGKKPKNDTKRKKLTKCIVTGSETGKFGQSGKLQQKS